MKKSYIWIVKGIVCLASLGSNLGFAKAGFNVFGSFFYDKSALDSDLNSNGVTTTTSSQDFAFNIGGGYAFDIGLYLGLKYLDYTNTQKISLYDATAITSPSQTVKTAFAAPGVSVGFVADKGFYILGTGLFVPEETVETTTINGTATSYSKSVVKGNFGYMADVGFTYRLSTSFGLGPQLTYYAANFNKHASVSDGEATSGSLSNYRESRIVPFMAMSLAF